MLSAGQLSHQLNNRHAQPCSQASSLSPAPLSPSSAAASLSVAAPSASQALPARYAAPHRISPSSASTSVTTAEASIAANRSDRHRSQLNGLGSGHQLCEAPPAPAAPKQLQQHLTELQTPPHSIAASGPIVPGKFYSSIDYPTHCRQYLFSRPPQQQQHQAPPPSASPAPPIAALPVSSLSRAENPIQAPPCYRNPSPVFVSAEPPPPPLLVQKSQPQRHSVRRRELTTAAMQAVMEPGPHAQTHASASYSSPYSQSTSSSQQYPQIRTDTTLVSSINSSSTPDPASKSASAVVAVSGSGSSCGGLRIGAPHSPVTGLVYQPYPTREQQRHASYGHTSPRGTSSSPRFAASNTSMACSSANDAGHLVLPRPLSSPSELYTSQQRNLLGQVSQQQHFQMKTPSQTFERRHSDTMDTVSRSLNTQNDPELVGLPPMRHNDEDEVVRAAGNAATLYSKGFLIATSSSAKESTELHDHGDSGMYSPPHLHDGEEPQPPRDEGEGSISQASHSRGPTASTSTGISHRLLTAEEINERRRASWVASHSMSQAQSAVAETALGDSAAGQKRSKNAMSSIQSTSNNLSMASGVSKGSRPAHRQLTKEEADHLIAQRQQQLAAEAAAAAAAAATAAAKDTTAHPQQKKQHRPSPSLTNTASLHSQSEAVHSSLSDSTKPWLLSGDGTHANYFSPAPASMPPSAGTNTMFSSSNAAAAKPMAFEWLRGTSGGGGPASRAGLFAESSVHSWPGVNPWQDSSVAGGTGSGGNANVNAAVAAFLGAAGGTVGDGGSSSDFGAPASAQARAGQPPSGPAATGFTWLPNTSNRTPRDQQKRRPQVQPQSVLSFVPLAPSQADSVRDITSAAAWGGSAGAIDLSGDNLHSAALTSSPSLLTASALQGLSQRHIEERICQCDVHLERLRQEREQLVHELQRRLHCVAEGEQQQQQQHSHTGATSWPGAFGPHAVAIPSSDMNIVRGGPAMTPHGTAAEGAAVGGCSGSAVDQSPLWPFFGNLVVDANTTGKLLPRGPVDKREPPAACIDPMKGTDAEELVERASAAAADLRQRSGTGSATVVKPAHQAASGAGEGGGGGGGSVGHRSAGERCGTRSRRRGETGNQRNNSNSNGASSSAGIAATSSNNGGGGHSASNRCSHDNTPQEQKYLQTDPFSMYMHNKKIATAGATTALASSRDTAA
ncbi:hypothetical protein LSCM1_06899 [Leishmania martiniquensis]|uniref:Uncharacterized protein n=1 Tax=Leishmania martiniquensis TaxID=1580590 RepID=A0A836HB25_9TRYP|nr:hypothetical protein LSCM1_06899 [Leishmania martiniquensis]